MFSGRHPFVSSVPDDPVAAGLGEVLPQAHWNADHLFLASGRSVVGRATSGDGVVDAIIASNDGDVLRLAGGILGFGSIPAGSITGLAAIATSGSATDLTSGTVPSARVSGAYSGITGIGTLVSGSIPVALITGLAAIATSGSASDLSAGTVPSARISGAYSGITGVGTLASGAIPTSLLTGTIPAGSITGLGYFATGTDAANLTGTLAYARLSGALPAVNAPALTGDVLSSAGSLATALNTSISTAVAFSALANTVVGAGKNLTVDTNSLFVDGTNHRVGIGNVAPGAKLDINVNADVSAALFRYSNTSVNNPAINAYGGSTAILAATTVAQIAGWSSSAGGAVLIGASTANNVPAFTFYGIGSAGYGSTQAALFFSAAKSGGGAAVQALGATERLLFVENAGSSGAGTGTKVLQILGGGTTSLASAAVFGWTTTGGADGTLGAGLSYISSGIIGVGTGAAGSIAGGLSLATVLASGLITSLSLKTGAPAGGTSGTWKLGVAASVSPTAPNRTIEVDIAGTTYYVAAKTTND